MTGAEHPAVSWDLLIGSVKGLAKRYSQDACLAFPAVGGRAVVLAVADGHGSKAYHRSDLGSRWAVEEFAVCATAFAQDAVCRGDAPENWPALLAAARSLPRQVVHRWRERVVLHESNAPAAGELPQPPSPGRPPAPDTRPYGSTLIGAVATGRLLVCWKLGDGDIALVSADGQAPDTPLYDGPDLGDETDSLCESEAWRLMRVHWQPFTGAGPLPAVLLSTDGLAKSFAERQGFVDFARGLGDRVAEQGLTVVQGQLEDWLSRAASYSGDDTTLVGAFPAQVAEGLPQQQDRYAEPGQAPPWDAGTPAPTTESGQPHGPYPPYGPYQREGRAPDPHGPDPHGPEPPYPPADAAPPGTAASVHGPADPPPSQHRRRLPPWRSKHDRKGTTP